MSNTVDFIKASRSTHANLVGKKVRYLTFAAATDFSQTPP